MKLEIIFSEQKLNETVILLGEIVPIDFVFLFLIYIFQNCTILYQNVSFSLQIPHLRALYCTAINLRTIYIT